MPRYRGSIGVAPVVHIALTAGAALLATGFLGRGPWPLGLGAGCVMLGFTAFLGASTVALMRSQGAPAILRALRLAAFSLVQTVAIGATLTFALLGWTALPGFPAWLDLHLAWGLFGWVELLILGVAYQVVPMFPVIRGYPAELTRWLAPVLLAALVIASLGTLFGLGRVVWLAQGAIALGFGVFALVTLAAQRHRNRRRRDATLLHWWSAMVAAIGAACAWGILPGDWVFGAAEMIELLCRAPLLSGLGREQLARVAATALSVHLDEGQWLFSQGDPSRRFYFLHRGQIRLFRLSPEGTEKIIEIVSPGQTFAEALMFLNAPRYPVCAAALEPADLIGIDARAFAAMLRESVDTCFVVMGALSQRLRSLIGEIDNLTLHNAKSRVARYLLAHLADDRRGFDLDIPKGVLASRLSVKPETFSRVIKQLTLDGVVSVHGAHVTITDHAALTQLAELEDTLELGLMPDRQRCGRPS